MHGRPDHDPSITGTVSKPSAGQASPSIFRDTFCTAKQSISCICYLSKTYFVQHFPQKLKAEDVKTSLEKWKWKMWKLSFRARPPSKSESWRCETQLSCETSSKSESWRCENEAFLQDLPQNLKVVDVKTILSCERSLGSEISCQWHLLAVRSLGCEISWLWDLLAVRISLLWDLLAARSLGYEISWLWDLLAVRSLGCEISWLWESLCCETSWLRDLLAMRSLGCEISWLWDLLAVRSLGCEISWLWWIVLVKIRNREVRLSNFVRQCRKPLYISIIFWISNHLLSQNIPRSNSGCNYIDTFRV